MAKIIQESVVITVSSIVKDSQEEKTALISDETLSDLEAVVADLLGRNGIVVEIMKAD